MIRKFPGKLFLMGEYFITKPEGEAVIIAVNRFIKTKTIKSEKFHLRTDYGEIVEGKEIPETMKIAREAVSISYEYINYLGIKKQALEIDVTSNLLENNIKIGLGSSAVIINAIIQSVLESHQVYLDKIKLFKLAVLCQKRLGDLSSGGDLAASVFTGMVYYTKYNEFYLEDQEESFKLLDEEWPGLSILNLEFPDNIELMVAWTGIANKTDNYLEVFNTCIERDSKIYEKFTKRAQHYVNMFVEGRYEDALSNYRQLMLDLEVWTKLNIETKELKEAINISVENNAYAKISGSGGGDCMIAMLPRTVSHNKKTIINEWNKKQIKYLDIGVWTNDTITKKR